jgi:HAD superfamily hydrolase (TIGR01509 family)
MNRAKAVIFDMDGVIVDSEPCHERAVLDVVCQIGYEDRLELRVSDFVGRSDLDLWAAFVERHKPAQTLQQLAAMKRRRVIEILRQEQPFFDGSLELIHLLAPHLPLAIASGSERLVVEEVLGFKGLRGFFSAIVSGSDVQRGKPEPDTFLRAAELLGIAPVDCWVIEDSKPGVAAALAAGMGVIAITNTHPAAELDHATHVVSTYKDIAALLAVGP